MPKSILVLNGPNLNLLGTRQPEIYGADTLPDVERKCRDAIGEWGTLDFRQSNYEGELVTWIQEARDTHAGILINPAAYSHTSVAILDALNMFEASVVEVHISDIHQREEFRHFSYVSQRADHIIVGKGVAGYVEGIHKLIQLIGS
ncbi:MAG: 3-dehydroquinate dehydratase [Paracoccaceae bacterium]|nr:3-dehydroquinate dehydratase [Paracoccaceae bacterium]MDG2260133.1 3-dehydroquinate dehydratase [Paracoccaceae bacterium]